MAWSLIVYRYHFAKLITLYKIKIMLINSPVLLTPLARATERGAVAVHVATIACTGTAGTWRVRSSTSRCLSTLASKHCVNKPIGNIKKTYEYWNQAQTTIWRSCAIFCISCLVKYFFMPHHSNSTKIGVRLISFEKLHRFHSYLACWFIISKHKSSSI